MYTAVMLIDQEMYCATACRYIKQWSATITVHQIVYSATMLVHQAVYTWIHGLTYQRSSTGCRDTRIMKLEN